MALDLRSREAPPTGSSLGEVIRLGLPMLVGAVSALLSGVIDTAMIGHYGATALTAVAGATTIFDVFANVVLASLVGHQILAARFVGRGEPAGVRRSLWASARFCGALAGVATLLCGTAGGWLTGLVSGNGADLRHIAAGFLLACGPTLLLLVPFTLLTATLNAYKRPRFAMIAGIAVNLVNLVLDWALIYGPGPLPRLGAVGSGLATTISWAAGVGCLALAVRRFGLRELLRQPGPGSGPAGPAGPGGAPGFTTSIPRLAWPAIVSQGLDYTSVAIFFAIIGGVGQSALAGGRIAFQLMVVVYGVLGAFAAGGRILIGRALGARDLAAVRSLRRAVARALLLLALPLGAFLVVAPGAVAALFTSFPLVVAAADRAVRLVGVCVPVMAWTLGGVSTLRACGKTRQDMYANLVAAVGVQLPAGWLLADGAGLGVTGAFIGVLCYWLTRGAAAGWLARTAVSRETRTPPPGKKEKEKGEEQS
jgi:MATE family multidrug resistance protein